MGAYVWSLHWSLAQFTGEVVFSPQSLGERTFAVLALLVTFILATLFVSSMTTAMTQLMIEVGKQSVALHTLRRYLVSQRISTALLVRIQRNAMYALAQQKKSPPDVLDLVSEPLQIEYHYELHCPALLPHPFFEAFNGVELSATRKLCHTAVKQVQLNSGDVVFADIGACSTLEVEDYPQMYVLPPGVTAAGKEPLTYEQVGQGAKHLVGGQWACEPVLWVASWMHYGSLTAKANSILIALDADKYRKLVVQLQSPKVFRYAITFVSQLNDACRDRLVSDLWLPDFDELLGESGLVYGVSDCTPSISMTQHISQKARRLSGQTPRGSPRGTTQRVRPDLSFSIIPIFWRNSC